MFSYESWSWIKRIIFYNINVGLYCLNIVICSYISFGIFIDVLYEWGSDRVKFMNEVDKCIVLMLNILFFYY